MNPDTTTWTSGNSTVESTFKFNAWRLATAGDASRFKIVTDQRYYGQSGTRRWNAGAAVNSVASASDNTAYVSFMFDSASQTFLGLGAIAAAALTVF